MIEIGCLTVCRGRMYFKVSVRVTQYKVTIHVDKNSFVHLGLSTVLTVSHQMIIFMRHDFVSKILWFTKLNFDGWMILLAW